jgi:hypothetical protein
MRESASAVLSSVCVVTVLWLTRCGPKRLAGAKTHPKPLETTRNHEGWPSGKSLQIPPIEVGSVTD